MGLIAFAKSSHGRPTLGRVKLSSRLRFGVLLSGEHDDSSSSLAGRLGAVELPATQTGSSYRLTVSLKASHARLERYMFTTERAAAPMLPHLPPRQPGAPGQLAFADRERVTQILADSGWANIDIQPLDVRCTLSEADLMGYISRLGPVGQQLQQLDEPAGPRCLM